jgi:hypothetical protein
MLRIISMARSGASPRFWTTLFTASVGAALFVTALAYAGSDGRKGTAGASELQIPVGARSTALGGTVVSDVNGIEAMFWNPAGLGATTGTEALFTHAQYFADMKLNYAGVAAKAGNWGTFGVAAKILSIGDVIVTTEAAPDGTGEILHPTFSVLGLSWGRPFTDRVNFGATFNYVHEDVANNTADGLAFDFGVQYITDWHGFRFGMAIKNIGSTMSFSGPGFDFQSRDPNADPNAGTRTVSFGSADFEMPSYLVLSSSAVLTHTSASRLVALGAFQNNNFSGDQIRGGLEWAYRDVVALRGSYFGTFNGTTDQQSGDESFSFDSGDDLYEGYALGGGFYTRFGDAGKVGVDLSWRPVKQEFDDVVEFGIKMNF